MTSRPKVDSQTLLDAHVELLSDHSLGRGVARLIALRVLNQSIFQ